MAIEKRQNRERFPNPLYQLDSFQGYRHNEFSVATLMLACDQKYLQSGVLGNPLMITMPDISERQFLLHAIGNCVRDNTAGLAKVKHITAQTFIDEFLTSKISDQLKEFRSHLTVEVDVLIIENLEFLIHSSEAEEELALILEYHRQIGNRVFILSSHLPKQLKISSEKLATQIMTSQWLGLDLPDSEGWERVIRRKAEEMGILITSKEAFQVCRSSWDEDSIESALIELTEAV